MAYPFGPVSLLSPFGIVFSSFRLVGVDEMVDVGAVFRVVLIAFFGLCSVSLDAFFGTFLSAWFAVFGLVGSVHNIGPTLLAFGFSCSNAFGVVDGVFTIPIAPLAQDGLFVSM